MRVDRPIIFSAPMVRALLDGRKTQTRRLAWRDNRQDTAHVDGEPVETIVERKPSPWQRALPGDRLWVRETWTLVPDSFDGNGDQVYFPVHESTDWGRKCEADNLAFTKRHKAKGLRWRPSIHMPRWASRLTLTVTATKIERLQEISEADAKAEGMSHTGIAGISADEIESAPEQFARLWGELHGAGAWGANPEVVALTFTVEKRNIDAGDWRDVPSDTEPKERA